MKQHCGRRDKHEPHRFWAHPREVIEPCVCDEPRCVCPDQEVKPKQARRRFSCDGELVVEGAPPHMPTQVDL